MRYWFTIRNEQVFSQIYKIFICFGGHSNICLLRWELLIFWLHWLMISDKWTLKLKSPYSWIWHIRHTLTPTNLIQPSIPRKGSMLVSLVCLLNYFLCRIGSTGSQVPRNNPQHIDRGRSRYPYSDSSYSAEYPSTGRPDRSECLI